MANHSNHCTSKCSTCVVSLTAGQTYANSIVGCADGLLILGLLFLLFAGAFNVRRFLAGSQHQAHNGSFQDVEQLDEKSIDKISFRHVNNIEGNERIVNRTV